ncbi:MAG TPA: HEPN domain-containing protein [Gemmataceae bacterium]|nr:HEPN domain-containing protein [Gemmataceae bacterium]
MRRLTMAWVRKAEADIRLARRASGSNQPLHDGVCFHCQQAAEKYLKALLQDLGLPIPYIHDLDALLGRLLLQEPALKKLRRGLRFLAPFAVDYRYPGATANLRQAQAALRWAERTRHEIRTRLGLPA